MDKRKIEILKLIDKANNSNYLEDFESLKKKDYSAGFLRAMKGEELVFWDDSLIFHLTKEGEKILREERLIEATHKKVKQKIIFDSNIYDLIANGNLNINLLSDKNEEFEFYITHIQTDEINKCPDEDKRAKLILFMTKLSPIVIPTNSFILGLSRLGEAKLGDAKLLEEIRKENLRHTRDALIGEVAIKNNFILITEDIRLKNKINSLNGNAINLNEFKEMLG